MKIFGITGPTGAGKTTALRVLEELGVQVIDADAVYHSLLEESAPLREALFNRFGRDILDETGKLDRKKLGGVVFDDPAALADLNQITHKFVLEEIDRQILLAEQAGVSIAIDAIALIESGAAARCDAVIAVLAPKEDRIRRIMAREGISEAYACKRVEAQRDDGFFRAHCGYVLENRDSPAAFRAAARVLFTKLLG